jgi:hypothetical protein
MKNGNTYFAKQAISLTEETIQPIVVPSDYDYVYRFVSISIYNLHV